MQVGFEPDTFLCGTHSTTPLEVLLFFVYFTKSFILLMNLEPKKIWATVLAPKTNSENCAETKSTIYKKVVALFRNHYNGPIYWTLLRCPLFKDST